MFDVKVMLEQELRYQQNLKQVYLGELRHLPEGCLSVTTVKGKDYYYKHQHGLRYYLGDGSIDEVKSLQRRKLLQTCLKRIDKNQVLMENVISSYQDISLGKVRLTLSKAYQPADICLADMDERSDKGWGYQKYQRSNKYPEMLVHRTLKGDFVRSKSEVIIANTLHMKGLQYRSEEVTKVGNYYFAPDFKILVPSTGKIKILEHFGMMHDSEYREKAVWKMSTYIENGYRPYEDILFTFEDLNGNIDAKNLELLITNFCM